MHKCVKVTSEGNNAKSCSYLHIATEDKSNNILSDDIKNLKTELKHMNDKESDVIKIISSRLDTIEIEMKALMSAIQLEIKPSSIDDSKTVEILSVLFMWSLCSHFLF